jgi:hypothetical protein
MQNQDAWPDNISSTAAPKLLANRNKGYHHEEAKRNDMQTQHDDFSQKFYQVFRVNPC